MRRTKKFAAVSMSAMLALSSMAGCTKKDAGDETTQATVASQPDTTAEEKTTAAPADTTAAATEKDTEASGEKANATEADKTTEEAKPTEEPTVAEKTTEAPTEDETEDETEEATKSGNGEAFEIKTSDALAKLLDVVKESEKTSTKTEITLDLGDLLASTVSLTDVKVKLDVDSFVDVAGKKGSGVIGVDLGSKELNVSGDLIRFAVDKDHSAFSIDALKLAAGVFGSEDAVSALLQGLGLPITTADIKKITSVSLPVGTDLIDLSAIDSDAIAFAKDYAKRILSGVDERSVKASGNKVEITPDGIMLASLARSVILNTTDEDIDKFIEIVPKLMPSVNEEKADAAIKAIMAEVEKGVKNAGMSMADLGLDDIEGQIEELKKKLSEQSGGMFDGLVESKEDLKAKLAELKKQFVDEVKTEEDYQEAIDSVNEAFATVFKNGLPKIVIEAGANGLKVSCEGEITLPESVASEIGQSGEVTVKFSVKSASEANKGEFKDVEGATQLSDVVTTVLNLVKTIQSQQGGQGGSSSSLFNMIDGL
ncbi:MAG: hypothetical protein IKX10_02590 [Lachnospiraceae bacterium]|nr:hypothetical protein [Lachnospiraceae bacterium]